MRTEIARIVADYLTANLATHLAAVPREGDVALPATPVVYDESRDGTTARGDTKSLTLPCLQVHVEQIQAEQVKSASTRFFDARVVVRYVLAKRADTAAQVNEASVVLRAVLRCLSRLTQTDTTRNNIALGQVTGAFEDAGVFAPVEGGEVVAGLVMTFERCRDTAA